MAISTKAPFTSLVVFTFTLNAIVAIDNSKFLGGNPFLWHDAVDISVNPNSPAYYSFGQIPSAPVLTIMATDVSSRGQIPPWDVTSGQLVLWLQK